MAEAGSILASTRTNLNRVQLEMQQCSSRGGIEQVTACYEEAAQKLSQMAAICKGKINPLCSEISFAQWVAKNLSEASRLQAALRKRIRELEYPPAPGWTLGVLKY